MPLTNLRKIDPQTGGQFTASDWNKMVSAVEAVSKISGDGNIEVTNAGDSLCVRDSTVVFWAKITGNDGGTPPAYAWTLQQSVGDGTWEDSPGGESGTTTENPIYERNGKSIPDGQVVRVYSDTNDGVFWCEYEPGGSGITVATEDFTPSYTGVDTLIIPIGNDSGLTFSQPDPITQPNWVEIQTVPADDTQWGVLTNGTQTIGGEKTFVNPVNFLSETNLQADGYDFLHSLLIGLGNPISDPSGGGGFRAGDPLGTVGDPGTFFLIFDTYYNRLVCTGDFGIVDYSSGPPYSVANGATGTDGVGSVFIGGLCVGVGGDTISVSKGGTGQPTLTAHGLVIGEGTSPVNVLTLTSGQLLIGQASGDPVAYAISGDATLSSAGAVALTNLTAGSVAITSGTHSGMLYEDPGGKLAASTKNLLSSNEYLVSKQTAVPSGGELANSQWAASFKMP